MSEKALKGKIVNLPKIDTTLTKEGHAADAKAIGDEIGKLNIRIDNIDPHFADNVGYSSAESGITAETVQAALDWIVANYLRITGGKISGNLKIEKSSPAMELVNTATGRTGTTHYSNSENLILSNKLDDDNLVGIWVKPETEAPKDYLDLGTYVNGNFTRYPIYGAHSKPTGTYAGTGSEETVVIETGGIGDVIMVNSGNGFAIVTPRGAMCVSGQNVYGLVSSDAKFASGVLTLNTADVTLNKNPGNYYWQVL